MKNGKPTNNRAARESKCPAWEIKCDNCGKQGHYKRCCQAKPKTQASATNVEEKKTETHEDQTQPRPVTGAGSFVQQMLGHGMEDSWDNSVQTGAGTIILGVENSEPLFPENDQENRAQPEREEAGNA